MEGYTLYGEDGRAVGTLRRRQEGLYVELEARTPRPFPGIGRVYLRCAHGERLLGVMEPFGGGMRCRRRLAEPQLRPLGPCESAVLRVSGGDEDWVPYADGIAGEWGRRLAELGALTRRERAYQLVAIPYPPGAAFPLTELFCLAQVRTIRGARHVVYAFSADGEPVLCP